MRSALDGARGRGSFADYEQRVSFVVAEAGTGGLLLSLRVEFRSMRETPMAGNQAERMLVRMEMPRVKERCAIHGDTGAVAPQCGADMGT